MDDNADNIVSFPSRDKPKPPPVINLPPVTKWLCALLLLIYAGMSLGLPPERQYWIDTHFGFVSAAYTGGLPFTWPDVLAPLTYALLHGSWEHVIVNVLTLMAFGAGVERWLGSRRMFVLFVLCSLAAIAVQFALTPHAQDPVIGASGGLSGLFAAVLVLMRTQGAMPERKTLWLLAGLWVVTSALFGLFGGPDGEPVAWIAHIGGFLAGLGLVRLFTRSLRRFPVVR